MKTRYTYYPITNKDKHGNIIKEFEIELLDDYMQRSTENRIKNMEK